MYKVVRRTVTQRKLKPKMRNAVAMVAAGSSQLDAAKASGYDYAYLNEVLNHSPAAKAYLEQCVEEMRVRSRLLIRRRLDKALAKEFPGLMPDVTPTASDDKTLEALAFSPGMIKIAGLDTESEWKGPPAPTPIHVTIQNLPDRDLRDMIEVIRRIKRANTAAIPVEARRLT